ncbi:unnamed protein product [Linum trigynum]|uniref:Uncharacterized protein n=1 Tax=Linum trigynum TaxID=586398 RepID=A0AAV2DSM6_9ROSI
MRGRRREGRPPGVVGSPEPRRVKSSVVEESSFVRDSRVVVARSGSARRGAWTAGELGTGERWRHILGMEDGG